MIVIKNGTVYPMTGAPIEDGCVIIEGKKIKSVGKRGKVPAGAQVIDAQGGWILPGIIEAHCHVGISEEKKGSEGNDCNETTDPVTPYLRGLDGINPMDSAFHNAVRAGITAVMTGPGSSNVVGGQFVCMKTCGRVLDDMVVKQPAAMKVAFGENPKNNYGGQNMMPASRMTIAAMLRKELFEAQQYKQAKEAGGDGFCEEFEKECYLPVLNGEIPLKAHVHRTDDILTAIRIANEFGVGLTLDHCSEGHLIAEEIKESGFPAIVGPSIASHNKIEIQYMDFKTAGLLHKAGVLVAITTDHPVSLIQYLPICAGLAAREGLGMEEGLKAITINPAKILRLDDRMGSLEPGKDADVAVFTGNPMEVFTQCLYTLIDGQVVYDYQDEEVKNKKF